MTRVDHTFTIPGAVADAQALFTEDVAPALHRLGGFGCYEERPGHLAFSDGLVNPLDVPRDGLLYSLGRRLSADRLEVDFSAEAAGTKVTIRGHASREIRDQTVLLGRPGHWPQKRPRS